MSLFTVIIPLYNKGPYIQRAINSVLNQTIKDYEIIVIDGKSTDEGPELVKKITDSRIIFFVQNGEGVSTARNQGVEFSKSNLITFLDADDEWMPKHLETILHLKEKYPCAKAYTNAYKILKPNGELKWPKYKEIPFQPWEGIIPNYFKSGALGDYPMWTSVACIPKEVFYEMEGFPENACYGEDADLFGKIALKYPIAFNWYIGGIYHWDASNRICNQKISLEKEPFVKTAESAIKKNLVSTNQLYDLKEYVANKEINRAKRHLDYGKKERCLQILKEQKTRYHQKRKFTIMLKAKIPLCIFLKIKALKNIKKR